MKNTESTTAKINAYKNALKASRSAKAKLERANKIARKASDNDTLAKQDLHKAHNAMVTAIAAEAGIIEETW